MRSRPARYIFDRFELHPAERRFLAGGVVHPLTPRAFDLLVAFVERAGGLWSKDELLDRVWPGLVVEENNLQVQVSTLRKLLGQGAIETVAGHGYRFTPAVIAEETPAPAERRHNLPLALTRFIGRMREIDECAGLLARSRLLTITGFGGMGKTRFALQMAEGCLAEYPDGVWSVELAALTDANLVVSEIAQVLEVREQAKRSLLDSIATFLRDRRLLLVLDNCEHLLHECSRVAHRLLQVAGGLVVLATSREPLRIAGETTYALSSLSFPEHLSEVSLADLARSDAVSLFVERARAVQHDFELTAGNASAVAEICHRLDGIPLAIELAAARVRVLSVEGVAQRLDQRFRLLKVADPTVPARQQTLEATIDWSYSLLNRQEKALFARLAAFTAGWTLEAAEDVGNAADIERWEILDLHGNLVERSLIVAGVDARYRFLESVRLYAQGRLAESGDEAAARTRHLASFVALANAGPLTAGPHEETAVARLNAERENLRAAYQWAIGDGGDPVSALRLVSPIGFWLCMNYFELGTPILSDLLARPEVASWNPVRFHGVATAAFLSYHRGRYPDAKRYAQEAVAIARQLAEEQLVASSLVLLGEACHGLGERAEALRHLREAAMFARRAGDPLVSWATVNTLAEVLSSDGDRDSATPLYEEAFGIARTVGSRNLIIVGLLNLARVALTGSDAGRGGALLREALPIFEEMGGERNLHILLFFSAGLASLHGEWERAARFVGASDRDLERMSMRREPADEAALAPMLAAIRRSLGNVEYAAAEAAGRALQRPQAARELRVWLEALNGCAARPNT